MNGARVAEYQVTINSGCLTDFGQLLSVVEINRLSFSFLERPFV